MTNFEELEADPSVAIWKLVWPWRKAKSPTSTSKRDRGFETIAGSISRGYHMSRSITDISRTSSIQHTRGTLMCYWRHQAHENPYVHIGEQDITAHVNFSDLIDEGAAAGLSVVGFSRPKGLSCRGRNSG